MISKYSALHRAKHNRFLFPVAFLCIYLSMRITFVNLKEWNFNFQSSQKISHFALRISTIPFLVRLNFWSLFTQQARQAKNLRRFFRLQMHLFFYFQYSRPNKGSQRICFACEILAVTSDVNLQLQNWRSFRTSFVTQFLFFFFSRLIFKRKSFSFCTRYFLFTCQEKEL